MLNSNDDVVVRRAVHLLISSEEATKAELAAFQQAEDHVVRAYATEVNSNTSNLLALSKTIIQMFADKLLVLSRNGIDREGEYCASKRH